MSQPPRGTVRISGIDVAKDRFVSVNGPPATELPKWGLTVETDEIEYHLVPAITYKLNYRVSRYNIVHMFNASEGQYAIGPGPLVRVVTEAHRTGLVPPLMHSRVIQDQPLEYLTIRIEPDRFNRIAGATAQEWTGLASYFGTVDPALTALCTEIRRSMIAEPLGIGGYLDSLADAVVTRLVTAHLASASEQAASSEALPPALVRRLAKAIEDKLDGPVKVTDLAEEAGLSRAHFSRAFAQSFGTPPSEYIQSRRNARARLMLTESDLSASQIAMSCGYANPSHLTTAFKREFGMTPSQYRRALSSSLNERIRIIASVR